MNMPSMQSMKPVPIKDDSVNYCFSIPTPTLAGPERDRIAHATKGAEERWLHDRNMLSKDLPVEALGIHQKTMRDLQKNCKRISDDSNMNIIALAKTVEPRFSMDKTRKPPVTTVWLHGDSDKILRIRNMILEATPIMLVSIFE